MTLEEIEALTPEKAASLYGDGKAQRKWLTQASARQIQEFYNCLALSGVNQPYEPARIALEIRLSEDALKAAFENLEAARDGLKSAEKMEQQTLVLVRFTKLLVWLTAALIFIGVIQICMMIWKP